MIGGIKLGGLACHKFEVSGWSVRSCKSNGVLSERVNGVYTDDELFLVHGYIISSTAY
jgi:hypothetical protein